MRSERHSKKHKKDGFSIFTKVWSVLYILITAGFCGYLIYMNLLPTKYLIAVAVAVFGFVLLIFPALFLRKVKKPWKITALVLSVFLMGLYGAGMFYMMNTVDFVGKVTETKKTVTDDYYVIARADSELEGAESIRGKKLFTYMSTDRNYSEARNELKDLADTEYEFAETLTELATGLREQTAELIFVSAGHYQAICSEDSAFKEETKIVYTVKIKIDTETVAKAIDVTREPFNIYVSGLDTEGTIDTVSRSDVNMIVTVNPVSHKVLLTSLPRDSYVELPGKGAMDKLTHTGLYGISESISTAEKLMGIDINYYAKVNYTTVRQLIDAIGGIDIESDYTFTTHGMGVYYEFYEGQNHLDGARALAFARERKSFADGDFQRNKNQQIVLEGVLKKALSSKTILTKYTSILNAVEDCVEMNFTRADIQKLIKMQIESMPSWSFERQSVTGTCGSELCYSTGEFYTSVVYPDEKTVVEAMDRIVALMD